MTSNQIKFWEYRERSRNNRAIEAETNRSNLAREVETNRANVAREKETNRANRTAEYQKMLQRVQDRDQFNRTLSEQQRMNDNTIRQQNRQFDEQVRSNKANEAIRTKSANTDKYKAEELNRANTVRESQQQTIIYETHRQNVAAERQRSAQIYETRRSNLANENQKLSQLSETQRSNVANENIARFNSTLSAQRINEERRHNRESEKLQVSQMQQQLFLSTLHEANQAYQSSMNRVSNIDTALIRSGARIGGVR